MKKNNSSIHILQLTDPHLRKEVDGQLLGMNTRDSLDAVIQLVLSEQEQPDILLATGDISQDGSVEAYDAFIKQTRTFACPQFWLAGNHDDVDNMARAASGTTAMDKVVQIGGWQIIMLDSSVPGKVYGRIDDADLRLLESTLRDEPNKHTLVCLHHHPVDIDCKWLDTIGLKNRDEFLAIIKSAANVRAVLWGHIHQEFELEWNGIPFLATPSTCVQFEPKSSDFAVGTQSPGYRWLTLNADGRVETAVYRADHIDFQVDLNSKGY